ncbi:hypothetical protein [Bradyrhizobium sp. SZCCHNRI3042]|uniref:hypothetical protein n=1 Tax=Bradyrhizobium sp. SZCCHNRI3042 TaxID=3057291 RepID=UPI00291660E7|nr:hypothetical protein [Bradyrhizobium sp. SZCCHNRI3042]
MKANKADREETDQESALREEHDRQIALMVVDALWQSQWIRGALQHYEYRGKRFDGLRQVIRMIPPESERPNISAIKRRLEEFVLKELLERHVDMHRHSKKNKRTITADELYKPNKRLLNTYGRNHWEVSLTRGDSKLFETTDRGVSELEAYCRANGVDPKSLLNIGYA